MVTTHNISDVVASLSSSTVVSLDTETTGLDQHDLPFACILANDSEVFYFDDRVFPTFWSDPRFTTIMQTPRRWVYQNAKFDMMMLYRKDITPMGEHHDIAVQARIQRNDHMLYNLESQGKRIKDFKKDTVKEYITKNKLYELRKNYFGEEYKQPQFDKVPLEIMQPYAEQDAMLTLKLYHHYNNLMDSEDQKVMEVERRLTPVLYQMETTGVRLSLSVTQRGYFYEKNILQDLVDRFESTTGVAYVNSAKSIQRSVTYPLPTTDKGNPSLTDDVIEDVLVSDASEKDKEILRLVQEIRHYDKRISTYYESFLNKMHTNHTIHCNMNQSGTRTGRMSSSNPNLQNVPKEEDSTAQFVIRGCFVPRIGHVFVSFDYAQMEYRMMAAYANQTDIIEKVMNGVDFHQATADMFSVNRKTAKTLNFMILYGGGDAKLGAALGIVLAEARRLKLKYFMALPKVQDFVEQVIRTAKSRGYVKNWIGRKLHTLPEFAYAAPNHLIQGGGADVVKTAMVRIAEEIPQLKMILQVHDQLVFDMKPAEFHFIPRIKEIMESVWEMNGMKLTVDVSWSATSLAERDMIKGAPNEG